MTPWLRLGGLYFVWLVCYLTAMKPNDTGGTMYKPTYRAFMTGRQWAVVKDERVVVARWFVSREAANAWIKAQ